MSLLTEVATNSLDQKKPIFKSVSIPINISQDNLTMLSQYDDIMVTTQIFDPQDASPPSEWNLRLKTRLAKFDSFSDLNTIS